MSGLNLSNQVVVSNRLESLFAVGLQRDCLTKMDAQTRVRTQILPSEVSLCSEGLLCKSGSAFVTQLWVWTRTSLYKTPVEWNIAKGDTDVLESTYPAGSSGLIYTQVNKSLCCHLC